MILPDDASAGVTRLSRTTVVGALLVLASCAQQPVAPEPGEPLYLTHGVIVGDLDSDKAVIWARGNRESALHLELLIDNSSDSHISLRQAGDIVADDDFTASIQLAELSPDTTYHYRVWLVSGSDNSEAIEGGFTTPPAGDVARSVRFAFSGDLGGQNVCRDLERGYVILDTIAAEGYDFFIGLGDMIYADDICLDRGGFGNAQIPGDFGQSVDLEGYRAHWRYNWADEAFQRLIAVTPYYPLWDDHEVINDFGPRADFRDQPPYSRELRLMPLGLRAFLEYNPIREQQSDPYRLYRKTSWGKHLDLFFLDNRQYRDPNPILDSRDEPKTMLGTEQKTWLKDHIVASQATWKVIVSSVPISVPTGVAASADGWANFGGETGFENELRELLKFMRDENIENVVFITTDIHHATGFEYRPFAESPGFILREFAVGPLSASPAIWQQLDESFNPQRLYQWGMHRDEIDGYEGFMKIMNYGEFSIDETGILTVRVLDGEGSTIYRGEFRPQA